MLTPLKDVLDGVVERLGLAEKAAGYRAVSLWAEAVGPDIAKRTAASRFIDGVLFVDVESSAWASQLTFMRETLVERLNERLAAVKTRTSAGTVATRVREVRFRVRTLRGKAGEAPLAGLALVRWRLRSLPMDEGGPECHVSAPDGGGGPSESSVFDAFNRLVRAHRRLDAAKLLSGWERCGACGRVYEGGGGCPCTVDGAGPRRAGRQ